MCLIACCHAGYRKSFCGSDVFFVKSASERLMRKTSSFSGTGPSTSSITWKHWLLWSKWILPSSKKRSFMSKTYVKLRWGGKPVCCCKLSLYAKECGLFWAVIEMTRHIYHVSALFLKSRPLHWFSWIYTRVLNHFRNKSASNAVYRNIYRYTYIKEISWRRGSEWGYSIILNTLFFGFVTWNSKILGILTLTVKNCLKLIFFQKEAKTAPKMPILFRLV